MKRLTTSVMALLLALSLYASKEQVLDNFEEISSWEPAPAEGVKLELNEGEGYSGKALKIDFDYQGNSGWAAFRKKFSLKLPENYEFSFWVRAEAPVTHFEFKLIDSTGQNVWWVNKRNFEYPKDWKKVTIKKRQISFAWGPSGGGEIREISTIEFAITSAAGGKGTVWLDELSFRELPPVKPYSNVPATSASSDVAGFPAKNAMDGNRETLWKSGSGLQQFYEIDFHQVRELGGMIIDWDEQNFARKYEIQLSEDKSNWTTLSTIQDSNGGRDYLYLPETETRYLRIRLVEGNSPKGFGIREIEIKPLEFASSPNAFFSSIAKDAPRGFYPRGFSGELAYWTVVGVDRAPDEALLNEDGAFEPSIASYSIEPFVFVNNKLITWSDVKTEQSLLEEYLPIPTVRWIHDAFFLDITASASNTQTQVQYRLTNRKNNASTMKLFLTVRPFQVNPPSQFLNTPGGTVPIHNLKWDQNKLAINEKHFVFTTSPPSGFGASSFHSGDISEFLNAGKLPASKDVLDSFGYASGAFEYEFALEPGAKKDITISTNQFFSETNHEDFKNVLNRVQIRLPEEAKSFVNTLKSNHAYILINRDGPAIQPGSRAYARSWIRDGSLTSTALLRLGNAKAAKEFIEWYSKFQYPNGKVPCCVDARGADPVPEHDSHGEFIYIIAEYYRYTKDHEFLTKLWPNVTKAVQYIDSLRKERRTPEFQKPEKRMFYGLLPESISHEGYSAKPVHSYWDDFFALRGLKDAVEIATALGKEKEQKEFSLIRDEFKADLYTSLQQTIAHHKIDYIPGSADLGDFDPTSTTIAIAPGDELENLPQKELHQTFERYYQESMQRVAGSKWEGYTPYELRNVGIFIRLGWKERAHELLQFFMQHRRPAGWNHWAEVVFRDPRAAKFIGDMPHTWVGSDFIRSFLDFFAYERGHDQSLVLGAGVLAEWAQSPDGVSIQNLQTEYGPLTYSLTATSNEARYKISEGIRIPPGGIILTSPLGGKQVVIKEVPAEVVLQN